MASMKIVDHVSAEALLALADTKRTPGEVDIGFDPFDSVLSMEQIAALWGALSISKARFVVHTRCRRHRRKFMAWIRRHRNASWSALWWCRDYFKRAVGDSDPMGWPIREWPLPNVTVYELKSLPSPGASLDAAGGSG